MLNFTLLFTHEIDSAYWSEWNLFGIRGHPGFPGIEFSPAAGGIVGLCRLLLGNEMEVFSLVIGTGGLFASAFTATFAGWSARISLTPSIAILVVILPVSVLQIWKTLQECVSTGDATAKRWSCCCIELAWKGLKGLSFGNADLLCSA
jgi:hypothetical protein